MIETAALSVLAIATWHDIDHDRGRGVAECFTENGTLTFGTRTFTGHDEIAGLYAQRATSGTRVARHVVSNFHRGASVAEPSVTYLLCLFASDGELPRPITTPASIADVTDRFAIVEGRLLLAARTLSFVFVDPGQAMAVPTG